VPAAKPYRGRFAPSPTGPLHLGSLIAALASYLDARYHRGVWLVRMDDLDPPREEPGAAQAILEALRLHGLQWDEPVMWQGQRHPVYADALERLEELGCLFRCDCTRAMLGPNGACRGRCLPRQGEIGSVAAVRVSVPPDCAVEFEDRLQGRQSHPLGREWPDFVLRRKDGLDAYQLAVVVDDAAQGITHIVRGSDLLDCTPRQVYLQGLLGLPSPDYCHLPVITNAQGQKFSKQNHAPALDNAEALHNLRRALRFLCQAEPPAGLRSCAELLDHAIANWRLDRVPGTLAITADAAGP
jgi:glutamyl-Q tRNA(Asp) synthetase